MVVNDFAAFFGGEVFDRLEQLASLGFVDSFGDRNDAEIRLGRSHADGPFVSALGVDDRFDLLYHFVLRSGTRVLAPVRAARTAARPFEDTWDVLVVIVRYF